MPKDSRTKNEPPRLGLYDEPKIFWVFAAVGLAFRALFAFVAAFWIYGMLIYASKMPSFVNYDVSFRWAVFTICLTTIIVALIVPLFGTRWNAESKGLAVMLIVLLLYIVVGEQMGFVHYDPQHPIPPGIRDRWLDFQFWLFSRQ